MIAPRLGNVELPEEDQAPSWSVRRVSEVDVSSGSDGYIVSVAIRGSQAPHYAGTDLLSTPFPMPPAPGPPLPPAPGPPMPPAPGPSRLVIRDSQDVVTQITTQLRGNRPAELALEICTSDEQVMWDGLRDFREVICWAPESLISITISLPPDFPLGLSGSSDRSLLTIGPSLRTIRWKGRLVLEVLLDPTKILPSLGNLANIALTACQLSISDCLALLRNAPRVETFELNELASVASMFPANCNSPTTIVLSELRSLKLTSSVDHCALFEAIEVEELSTAHVSFFSHGAVSILTTSIPWANISEFSLDAPYVVNLAEFLDSVMGHLDSSGNPDLLITINKERVVMNGQRMY